MRFITNLGLFMSTAIFTGSECFWKVLNVGNTDILFFFFYLFIFFLFLYFSLDYKIITRIRKVNIKNALHTVQVNLN